MIPGTQAQRRRKTAVQTLRNWIWTPPWETYTWSASFHLLCHLCRLYIFQCKEYNLLCRKALWLQGLLTPWLQSHIFQTLAQDCTVSQSTIFPFSFFTCFRSQSVWHAIFHPVSYIGRVSYRAAFLSPSYLSWCYILSRSSITNWGKNRAFTHHATCVYNNAHRNVWHVFNSHSFEHLPTCTTDIFKHKFLTKKPRAESRQIIWER